MDLLQFCSQNLAVQQLENRIFNVNEQTFEGVALDVFRYQYQQVEVYNAFCNYLKRTPDNVAGLADIPFLPIELFKSNKVIDREKEAVRIFESSGTTGSVNSKHHIANLHVYERSFKTCFEQFYGKPGEYVILAMLPSYLERENSSLVYMAKRLIELGGHPESGFFLHLTEKLITVLNDLKLRKQKTILLGVTFALLDFAEQFKINFPDLVVMETGGMKGRREEMTRDEVHAQLTGAFGVSKIHSEYGMTELLSQGYSKGDGLFETSPWMRIVARDLYDPMQLLPSGKTGAVNVIDLANLYSCSFIATSDMGKTYEDGAFEIMGRMDNSELRGCNLMYL